MSAITIKKNNIDKRFNGCDRVVLIDGKKSGEPIRLLQLTDMQFIDSSQQRQPDRLRDDERKAWIRENFDALCTNQIKTLIAQTRPDMIFITGDMVYGEFDDSGENFKWFCNLMESFEIPWAPVFGNHDNESYFGVDRQCEILESCPYCLFKRGNVSGNGNYSVGIAKDGNLIRVIHMLDTNGCKSNSDAIIRERGIYKDQIDLINKNAALIATENERVIPAFLAYHIPTKHFKEYSVQKGYVTEDGHYFNIGVTVPAKDGDFGYFDEKTGYIKTDEDFDMMLKNANVDAVFVGHLHKVNICINADGIKWVHGLKTGQYDYHVIGQTGGTLITLYDGDFDVQHIPALTRPAPYPADAPNIKAICIK